jgi:hypothetical protein
VTSNAGCLCRTSAGSAGGTDCAILAGRQPREGRYPLGADQRGLGKAVSFTITDEQYQEADRIVRSLFDSALVSVQGRTARHRDDHFTVVNCIMRALKLATYVQAEYVLLKVLEDQLSVHLDDIRGRRQRAYEALVQV